MTDHAGPPADTVAEVAERLMGEFGDSVPLHVVSACVLSAQRDLDRLALNRVPPMLLDRLARARLADVFTQPAR